MMLSYERIQLYPIKDGHYSPIELALDYVGWFNDANIRQHLFPTTPRKPAEILRWLKTLRDDPLKWYASIFFADVHLGHVGLTVSKACPQVAEASIVIGRRLYWQRGIGGTVLDRQLAFARAKLGISCVTARIKAANLPSIKLFESCGFRKESASVDKLGFATFSSNTLDAL